MAGLESGLETSLLKVAAEFESRLDDLAVEHVARSQEIEEFSMRGTPEVWEVLKRITRDSRRLQAVHMRRGMSLPESCPPPDAESIHLAVRAGASLSYVIQAYGVGHMVTSETWLDSVDQVELEEGERRACIRTVTRFVNAYNDRIMALVTEEYQRETGRAGPTREHIRLRRLRDLMEGVADSAEGIDYRLEAEHLGVVASGRESRAAVNGLAAELKVPFVWAPAEPNLAWAWFRLEAGTDARSWNALKGFTPPGDSSVAVGDPAAGLAGFRQTHREAGEAHVVGVRLGLRMILYRDVRLEAFAMRDEAAAKDLTASVLGELNEGGERAENLRQTLRAYFSASQNATSAAASLGVHEQTVSRRLQAIEEALGGPVNTRRAELELALRLKPLLAG
jgi:hypothetical protein